MRNLKRALSLVMAAAMLIGMMAVSASAADNYEDFTDKDEIVNTEAVATMSPWASSTARKTAPTSIPLGSSPALRWPRSSPSP